MAWFLLPKNQVVYLKYNSTMRQALERMEFHRYTSVPIIDDRGKFVGILTEGDLLWKIKNTPRLTFKDTEKVALSEIERHTISSPISIYAEMEDLIAKATEQNFVPIVDDNGIFIGIVRRRDIISYCTEMLKTVQQPRKQLLNKIS